MSCLSAVSILIIIFVSSSVSSAQQHVSVDVRRHIDSALTIMGMHERDLAMPHDLIERDRHRTTTLDALFISPYSSIDLSEQIADRCLDRSSTSMQFLTEELHRVSGHDSYKRPYLDNMMESDVVFRKLKLPASVTSTLNLASSIVLLRHTGLLIHAVDAIKTASSSRKAEILTILRSVDSAWRISQESERTSVWDAHREEERSFNNAASLYNSISMRDYTTPLSVCTSLHDDLLRISRELNGARDILIDSVKTIVFETPYGRIAVGGPGNDVYQGRYTMIVDVGGDDIYQFADETVESKFDQPVRVVVDLAGNDSYRGGDFSIGSGVYGGDILLDHSGNDSYAGGSYSIGSGLMGLGVVHDLEGNDMYTSGTNTQGAGIFGIGILVDDQGNDTYRSHAQSQAFAGTLGAGLLADKEGNDTYIASSPFVDVLRYSDHQITFAQGAALGSRPHASGGIAVLADGGGNDTYVCDIYGQGTGYWFGIGSLIDRSGDDRYVAYQYAQGSGVHFATGYLRDVNGNDVYVSHGVSQGCGHDVAYGFLFDEAGDDTYQCESLSLGAGNANAVSIAVDLRGNDSYIARDTNTTMGFSDYRRGYGMIGLFVDAHGNDRYTTLSGNNSSVLKSTYGLLDDRNDTLLMSVPAAGSQQSSGAVTLPSSIDSLFVIASASFLRFQSNVEPARKKLGTMGLPALSFAEERMGTLLPRQRLTIEGMVRAIYATDPDSTVAMLNRCLASANLAVVSAASTIISSIKTKGCFKQLSDLLNNADWRRRRLAAYTLGEIRDTSAVNTLRSMLHDQTSYVRARVAFAIGANDQEPLVTLGQTMSDTLQIVRNSAIEGINRGKRRSVKEITKHLDQITSQVLFNSNVRLLANADTSAQDKRYWTMWVKKLQPDRLASLRRISAGMPQSLRSTLPVAKAVKPKRKKA